MLAHLYRIHPPCLRWIDQRLSPTIRLQLCDDLLLLQGEELCHHPKTASRVILIICLIANGRKGLYKNMHSFSEASRWNKIIDTPQKSFAPLTQDYFFVYWKKKKRIFTLNVICIKAKSRKYQGVFKAKSRVKTWQNRGIWSQQWEHKQVPKRWTEPGVRKG